MPVIGITLGYENCQKNQLKIHDNYIKAVIKAGGTPLLFPPLLNKKNINDLKNNIDGVLFTGGCDLDPRIFKQEPHKHLRRVDPVRDKFEIELVNWCLENNIPLLALCRGIQVLNIACGGTIIQHLEEGIKHDQQAPYYFPIHDILLTENSYLQKIYEGKTKLKVNSFHHQAIDKTGKGLVVQARASDNIIEAVIKKNHPFCVGVQWHPERMYAKYPVQLNLFQEFVKKCHSN